MTRLRTALLHLLVLAGLAAAGIALATWTGGLWPFDLRFSALITLGGIAVLAIAWWPAALALLALAAMLPQTEWRLALWPLAVLAMVALHGAYGPGLGFMPLGQLGIAGALRLYAIPTALPILAGSALRDTVLPHPPRPMPAAHSQERSLP